MYVGSLQYWLFTSCVHPQVGLRICNFVCRAHKEMHDTLSDKVKTPVEEPPLRLISFTGSAAASLFKTQYYNGGLNLKRWHSSFTWTPTIGLKSTAPARYIPSRCNMNHSDLDMMKKGDCYLSQDRLWVPLVYNRPINTDSKSPILLTSQKISVEAIV